MGGFIRSNVEREETSTLNTAVNTEINEKFKSYCKRYGYPLNVIVETFMKQFMDGKITIGIDEAVELSKNAKDKSSFSTSINAKVHRDFKVYCKENGFKINGAITVFMNKFSDGKFAVELVELDD